MCNKNINEILVVDFSTINDEFNWITDSSVPIETVSGQLRLVPENATTSFRRGIGVLDASNNRIKVQINMDLYRPQTSTNDKINVVFGVYIGTTLIDQFTVYQEGISAGEYVEFNFDRLYKYDSLSGNISLKISVVEGYENQLFLDYLKVYDFNFCDDEIRTYFVIDQLFEKSFTARSAGIQLLEWKVDGVETLTPEFFSENLSVGGNPLDDWLFAKANIDGSNRVSDDVTPNTFNPFADEFGLVFDTIDSFHGGKPTGTQTSSDYGSGIMTIGFEKPSILNGSLSPKDGVFFIDLDYTKSLKVVFNVLMNDFKDNVFDLPFYYRKYTIIWDVDNCQKSFYYQDQLASNTTTKIDSKENGFLFGLTGGLSLQTIIACDQSFSYTGESGTFEFQIDFGTDTGICGINYNAYGMPDKFEIEWNGQIFTTGYVGDSQYNQQLINLGISPSEINTVSPGNGIGVLSFEKTTAFPNTAKIRITAPLTGTSWSISGICPQAIETDPFAEILFNDTMLTDSKEGTGANDTIYYDGVTFYPVTDVIWQRRNGTTWIDDATIVNTLNVFSLSTGLNEFRLKALDANLVEVYSNVLQYLRSDELTLYPFYYQGIDGTTDPETNCWVDYVDEFGITQHFIVGDYSNGCQEIMANSIVMVNNVETCSLSTCNQYAVYASTNIGFVHTVDYLDCNEDYQTISVIYGRPYELICAKEIISDNGFGSTLQTGNNC